MQALFVDIFTAGGDFNFEGTKHYVIAACGMTSFAICEDTSQQKAKSFARALLKMWLRFGLSHAIVVDKDSGRFCQDGSPFENQYVAMCCLGKSRPHDYRTHLQIFGQIFDVFFVMSVATTG